MSEIAKSRLRQIYIVAFFVLSCCFAQWSFSGHLKAEEAITYPQAGAPNPSGYRLTIGKTWSDAEGYRAFPILIQDIALVNPTEDREFKVEIVVDEYRYRRRRMSSLDRKIVVPVTIPAGQVSGFAYGYMPQASDLGLDNRYIQQTVYHNGRKLIDLSFDRYYGGYRGQSIMLAQPPRTLPQGRRAQIQGVDSNYSTLVIDSEIETFDKRKNGATIRPAALVNQAEITRRVPLASYANSAVVRAGRQRGGQVYFLPISEVPQEFVGLSAFRRIIISLDDFQALKQFNENSFSALMDWTASGNPLYIVEVNFNSKGDPTEYLRKRIKRIDTLIGLKEPKPDEPFPWRIARAARGVSNNGLNNTLSVDEIEVDSLDDLVFKHPIQFARRYGTGEVIGVRGQIQDLRLEVTSNDLNHSTEMERLATRLGFTPETQQAITTFTIPGVGMPPANTFRILITLFFAIVGPLNYILLRKWKRLNLLLFTLPFFAAMACLSLVTYAFVNDGLVARGRVISYSIVDQENERVVSYSRQTFYNALSVQKGYVYPDDSLAFPHVKNEPHGPCEIEWEPELQRLKRGNIGIRNISAFGVVRSAKTSSRMDIEKSGNSISVNNRLKADILTGVIWDEDGNIYLLSNVANGESGNAEPTEDTDDLIVEFRRHILLASNDSENASEPQPAIHRVLPGIIQHRLTQLWEGFTEPMEKKFIVVLNRNPEVPLPINNIQLERSLHVVEGRW